MLLTASPYNDGPVRISGQDVSVLSERQARHVLRTVTGRFEYTVSFVQGITGVQGPETDMTFAASDDLIAFQGMEFGGNDRVHWSLNEQQQPVNMSKFNVYEYFLSPYSARKNYVLTNLGLRDLMTLVGLLPIPYGYVMVVAFVYSAQKTTAVLLQYKKEGKKESSPWNTNLTQNVQ